MALVITDPYEVHLQICRPHLFRIMKGKEMAEVIKDDVVVSLSATEKVALLELLDAQTNLDPRLTDLNNSLQTV